MVKCWYLLGDGSDEALKNPRQPNQTSDGDDMRKISWTSLSRLNISYFNLEIENYEKFNTFTLIKKRYDLQHEYKVCLTGSEFNFVQHMHEIDEIRFILDGELYYDIYDKQKKMIRIHLVAGDLLIIPKYTFHRTILPTNIQSVTFLQLTQSAIDIQDVQQAADEEKKDEDQWMELYLSFKSCREKCLDFYRNQNYLQSYKDAYGDIF